MTPCRKPFHVRRLLCLFSLLLWSGAASAAHFYVEQATGLGVSRDDLLTASALVRSDVPEVSSNDIVEKPGDADFVLRPNLMRLGDAYLLTLSKLKDGRIVFSSQLKAERMDELDKVAMRLTRSVLENERAADHPQVGEITDQEAHDGTQRRPARQLVYVGLGGTSLVNLNTSGVGYSLGLAYAWDVNRALVKFQGEGDFNGSAFFVSGGIGGNYFLSMRDIAPYLSADVGAGVAKIDAGGLLDGQTVAGFVFGAGAGVELLRASSVNVDIGFHAGFLFHDNQLGRPEAVSLRLGVYF